MLRVEDTITEFLAEAERSSSAAVRLCQQDTVVRALFQVLEDSTLFATFLEPVCETLFRFCRSDLEELQRFSSYFIPAALALYLQLQWQPSFSQRVDSSAASRSALNQSSGPTAPSGSNSESNLNYLRPLEVYLLAAYNIETCDSDGKELVHSFTVPVLHRPSIYHESIVPASLSAPTATTTPLTEGALWRLEQQQQGGLGAGTVAMGDLRVVIGPFGEISRIRRDNIQRVAALLMRVYNANISYMPAVSRESTLRGAQKLIEQRNPRIELGSDYLLELLHCANFSMFNGQYVLGNETLTVIRRRARQCLMADVCLVANAMWQSMLDSKDSAKAAGHQPMGIRVTVNSSFKNLTKNVLTNASFRTRKLSEDVSEDEDVAASLSSGVAPVVGVAKREMYKSQLHETLGSIDEGIELSQVHIDTETGTTTLIKNNSASSAKVRKGSLVLVDSSDGTVSNGNGTTPSHSTAV